MDGVSIVRVAKILPPRRSAVRPSGLRGVRSRSADHLAIGFGRSNHTVVARDYLHGRVEPELVLHRAMVGVGRAARGRPGIGGRITSLIGTADRAASPNPVAARVARIAAIDRLAALTPVAFAAAVATGATPSQQLADPGNRPPATGAARCGARIATRVAARVATGIGHRGRPATTTAAFKSHRGTGREGQQTKHRADQQYVFHGSLPSLVGPEKCMSPGGSTRRFHPAALHRPRALQTLSAEDSVESRKSSEPLFLRKCPSGSRCKRANQRRNQRHKPPKPHGVV